VRVERALEGGSISACGFWDVMSERASPQGGRHALDLSETRGATSPRYSGVCASSRRRGRPSWLIANGLSSLPLIQCTLTTRWWGPTEGTLVHTARDAPRAAPGPTSGIVHARQIVPVRFGQVTLLYDHGVLVSQSGGRTGPCFFGHVPLENHGGQASALSPTRAMGSPTRSPSRANSVQAVYRVQEAVRWSQPGPEGDLHSHLT